jgi:hypothetical protein
MAYDLEPTSRHARVARWFRQDCLDAERRKRTYHNVEPIFVSKG